jgi:lysophospholipase L1-like esterase
VSPMLEDGKPRDIYVSDGLHMNRDGYVIWARIVKAALLPNTVAEERICRSEIKS